MRRRNNPDATRHSQVFGGFGPPTAYPVGAAQQTVATGDLDGDGVLDLAVANANDSTVSTLFGNGDGTFAPPQTFAATGSQRFIAIDDFNSDSAPDLAVVTGFETVVILINQTDAIAPGAFVRPAAGGVHRTKSIPRLGRCGRSGRGVFRGSIVQREIHD